MTLRKKRLLIFVSLGVAVVGAFPFIRRAVADYLVYRHHFVSEMRVVAPDGSITFRPYELFLEDKGHMVQAAFLSKALWPTHHISSADHDYLFGPFGRVVILTTVGFHGRAITDTKHWSGDLHSFPFPDAPMSEKDFLQFYATESSHELPTE